MVKWARNAAPFQEIWALPVADDAAATASKWTVTFAAAGFPVAVKTSYTAYIGGRRYVSAVSTSDTAATAAAAFAAVVNADAYAYVTATSAAGVVTLTAKNAGKAAGVIDVRSVYYGDESAFHANVTIAQTVTGAMNPDITLALAGLNAEPFDWIVAPFDDASNRATMSTFLDGISGRWSPIQQLYGHAFMVSEGTVGALTALGLSMNDPHITMVGTYKSPTPGWAIAATWGAMAAKHLQAPPELSRPLQFLTLPGVLAPSIADRFAIVDRNVLYYSGIALYATDTTGAVKIDRSITTYRLNAAGFSDSTWLDVQTIAQTVYMLRYLRTKVTNIYGRVGLADDDTPPVQGIARPRDIRNTLIAGYAELVSLGVVENLSAFETALIVERNATDANRVDVYLPYDVVNQLRVIAVNAVTYLQFPSQS
jgi:phage tail sheath gpL-like